MKHIDTGLNVPESLETLRAQQAQLVAGKRHVQMFPQGQRELPIPSGFHRHENARGVFHYHARSISAETIDAMAGRENEFLNLGPYNKSDIAERMARGEPLVMIAEFDANGTEIRAAAGTTSTASEQREYFEKTKTTGNTVMVCNFAHLIMKRMAA